MSTEPSSSAAHPLVLASAKLCGRCLAPIAWARTETGKAMPISLEPDPAGNVAVRVTATGQIRARVLTKERFAAEGTERLHLPHVATCGKKPTEPRRDGVVPLYKAREERRRRQGVLPKPIPEGGLW